MDTHGLRHLRRGDCAGRRLARADGRVAQRPRHRARPRLRHRGAEAPVPAEGRERASGSPPGRSPSRGAAATRRPCGRRRAATGDRLGPQRHEDVHHAGVASAASAWCSRARTPDAPKQQGITAFVVEHGTPGFTASKHLLKLGCRSSDTAELTLEDVRVPDAQRVGEVDRGFTDTMRILDRGRISIAAMALGLGLRRARDGRRATRRSGRRSASPSPSSRRSSGCSPTRRPSSTPRPSSRTAPRGSPTGASRHSQEASMAKLFASEAATRACNSAAAGARRVRLHARVRRRAAPARREALRDRRGDQRGPAHGHREAPPLAVTRAPPARRRRAR